MKPAVDAVSFEIFPGETVALVGESGSGKSSVARAIVGLNRVTSGSIVYDGEDLAARQSSASRRRHRREIQMIFQDPFASLNPRMRVGDIISEPWKVNAGVVPRSQWGDRLGELMRQVGLDPTQARHYPAQFSGGQRQRICIARALALEPRLVICDEAVSALDVSIQAQILNLLEELQDRLGLSYLFISHDLGVVRHMSNRVVVMYHGEIVESGPTEQIYEHPEMDYTKELLAAEPSIEQWRASVGLMPS
jgi:peptide/nickel transport system ATP-binding protein/oligopeptide transport system ATP-binding protein